MKNLPLSVRYMYKAFTAFILLCLFGIVINSIGNGRSGSIEQTPSWALWVGLVWYLLLATSYLSSLGAGLFNLMKLIRRPTIHFYASCAVCTFELGLFLFIWTH